MIRIRDISLPPEHDHNQLLFEAARMLRISGSKIRKIAISKRSVDARKKPDVRIIYTVDVWVDGSENKVLKQSGCKKAAIVEKKYYKVPKGLPAPKLRPVIVGFGPAGIFAALILARNGYRPVVLERGSAMEDRDRDVREFFSGSELNERSNIQFGEGGAGAYSDGKLTTRIGDNRCELVLQLLEEHGAPHNALQAAKPHIGTDLLKDIVVSMRKQVSELGGTVRFQTQAKGLLLRENRLQGLKLEGEDLPCDVAVLAIGHSARDSFFTLQEQGVWMQAKPFSVGVRAEHLQEDIDRALYGKYLGTPGLPAGEYALSHREGDRGCYSFCMCPGGEVVAAASEAGGVVTNGMSYHARAGKNANAALVVSVGPEDFGSAPLDGIAFQRQLERTAFALGGGDYQAPVQLWGDFAEGRVSTALGRVTPSYPRGWQFRQLDDVLPQQVCGMLRRAMPQFGKKMRGYDASDTVFTGVETRTSSPVRITRGDDLYSLTVQGLIPCGEGAGYAGGIMSAAVDGIRAAEAIMARFAPMD